MESWSWMAASVRGRSHVESGMPRQDHYWVGSSADGRVVAMIVCDGAGGVSHGGAGAALTVRALRDLARACMTAGHGAPSSDALTSWLDTAREVLERAAKSTGLPVEVFATTALIAVSDGCTTTTAHIGDGFIAGELADGRGWRSLSAPQRGEYAGTTAFLTDELVCPVTSTCAGAVGRLCLSTDGLEPVAWDDAGHAPHDPFFRGIVGALTVPSRLDASASDRLKAWLRSPALQGRVHDDLTLCLASRAQP